MLDDQNEIKDFEVLNVKVRDGYEEYSDVDSDSDDYNVMMQSKDSIYITVGHFYSLQSRRSYRQYYYNS